MHPDVEMREDLGEEIEVTCPLDGHEAVVQLQAWPGEVEHEAVVWCSRFGDEPVTCHQECLCR